MSVAGDEEMFFNDREMFPVISNERLKGPRYCDKCIVYVYCSLSKLPELFDACCYIVWVSGLSRNLFLELILSTSQMPGYTMFEDPKMILKVQENMQAGHGFIR